MLEEDSDTCPSASILKLDFKGNSIQPHSRPSGRGNRKKIATHPRDITAMIEEAIWKSFATEMQKLYKQPLSPNRSPSPGLEPGVKIGNRFQCKRPGHFRRDCPKLSGNLHVVKND